MQATTPPDADEGAAPAARIRVQYHRTTLAVKHGISRAEARKVLARAGLSREKADELALKKAGKGSVDEATDGQRKSRRS